LPDRAEHPHEHPFTSWAWSHDKPLSLPKLRSVLETLPDGVYRAKGIVHVEELPAYRYVLQMVGKRYHLDETGRWGSEPPRSDIVMIGSRDGIDCEALQQAFDACVGTGDESQSPVLRLARKLGLEERTKQHQAFKGGVT
jgi:G3E family GTPase